MRRLFKITASVVTVAVMFGSVAALSACGGEDEYSQWTLSDGITASFTDNGSYGYILTIDGSGAMPDYSSESQTPWYGRAGRVTGIVISDGITHIGDYSFIGCVYVDYIILPESVTSAGDNSFAADAKIYAYSEVTYSGGADLYVYSEEQPSTGGDYWHFRSDGTPVAWESLKILFIGNSFTYYNDMPSIFEELAFAAGEVVEVESITHGSYTLTKYADPDDVLADENVEDYNKGCGRLVDETLRANDDYDAIILQEQSTRPLTNYDAFLTAARTLKEKIDQTQEDCDVYLYATWGFPAGVDSTYASIPELESALRQAYATVGAEIGAEVCYVGEAFTYVYQNYGSINLYNADGRHPSYEGSYLAACVHVATILGCDPRAIEYDGDLSSEVAQILREVAYSVVFG